MKILADQYLYKVPEILPNGIEYTLFDPEKGLPGNVAAFDALLIRTVTPINSQTLPHAGNMKFIGTATAGFDHVDTAHLKNLGIAFERSEGCNANSVGEYVIAVLHKWAELRQKNLKKITVGIAGCGNTGSSVHRYISRLGIASVLFDPPKEKRDPVFISASLNELLSCDVLTFHTPLTKTGLHPTFHLCSMDWLKHGFELIINTARGGVVDEQSLLQAKSGGLVKDFILDVWENEPNFSDDSARNALFATPHIAGYSREAKWRASEIVISQLCKFFDLFRPDIQFNETVPNQKMTLADQLSFTEFLWENNQIDLYDRKLRELIGLDEGEKARKFAELRSATETRFEYSSILKQAGPGNSLPPEVRIFYK